MSEIITQPFSEVTTPIAVTIGMFDGVHLGHRRIISTLQEEARKRNLASAVLTFRRHPQLVLRPQSNLKMIMPLKRRVSQLEKLKLDYILLFDFTQELSSLSAYDFIKMLRDSYNVKLLMIGFNHRFGHNRAEGFDDYVRYGKELGVEILRGTEEKMNDFSISSSLIRGLIQEGNVAEVTKIMGKPYEICGEVVHGFANGRKLGFPTANIQVAEDIILPANGVYAVLAKIDGDPSTYEGMCNIGVRPTLNNGTKLSVEVNIFDFSDDIYGKYMSVAFISKLRGERKMKSLDELTQQLALDRDKSKEIIAQYKTQ